MRIKSATIAFLFAPLIAHTQATTETFVPIPQISVSARGETKVSPDRATIQISVQTRASTAAAAGFSNASKQRAVIDALRRLGLGDDQLSTINFNVYPEQRYEPNKNPVIIGYVVTNTIVADVRDLTKVGAVIDAALGAGANLINSLQFYSANTGLARKSSISAAVQTARSEAETAAQAAGGSLGALIELTIGSYYAPPPRPMYMAKAEASQAAETPVNPGQETVSVEITTRWRFIPNR